MKLRKIIAIFILQLSIIVVAWASETILQMQGKQPLHKFHDAAAKPAWLSAIKNADIHSLERFVKDVCVNGYLPDNRYLMVASFERIVSESLSEPLDSFSYANEPCRIVSPRSVGGNLEQVIIAALSTKAPQKLLAWATQGFFSIDQDPSGHKYALQLLSEKLNPNQVLLAIESLSPKDIRQEMVTSVYRQWIKQNPTSALVELNNRYESYPEYDGYDEHGLDQYGIGRDGLGYRINLSDYGGLRTYAMQEMATRLSAGISINMDGLYSWQIDRLVAVQLEKLAETDPSSAFDQLNVRFENEEVHLHYLESPFYKTFRSIVHHWMRADYLEMLDYISKSDASSNHKWTIQALVFAASVSPSDSLQRTDKLSVSDSDKDSLRLSIVHKWLSERPDEALRWIDEYRKSETSEALVNSLTRYLPISRNYQMIDGNTTKILLEMHDVSTQKMIVGHIVENMLGQERNSAKEVFVRDWVNSLDVIETQTVARQYMEGYRVKKMLESQPLLALQRSGGLKGPDSHNVRFFAVNYLLGSYTEETKEWLATVDISEKERAQLKEQIRLRGY